MHIPSIGDLIRAHSDIAFAALAALLGVVGYLEIRVFPKKLGAYWTLSLAVFIAAFALFHSPLGALGRVLGVAILLVGLVVLVGYYTRHQKSGGRDA